MKDDPTTKKADVVAKWKGEAWSRLGMKYVVDCYEENCDGKMKEIRRCDWWSGFVEIELCCEECEAESIVVIEKGTLGT